MITTIYNRILGTLFVLGLIGNGCLAIQTEERQHEAMRGMAREIAALKAKDNLAMQVPQSSLQPLPVRLASAESAPRPGRNPRGQK